MGVSQDPSVLGSMFNCMCHLQVCVCLCVHFPVFLCLHKIVFVSGCVLFGSMCICVVYACNVIMQNVRPAYLM